MDRDITRSMLDTYRHRGRRVAFSRLMPYTADTAGMSCPAAHETDRHRSEYPGDIRQCSLWACRISFFLKSFIHMFCSSFRTDSATPVPYRHRPDDVWHSSPSIRIHGACKNIEGELLLPTDYRMINLRRHLDPALSLMERFLKHARDSPEQHAHATTIIRALTA
jgi:hypothetical protein